MRNKTKRLIACIVAIVLMLGSLPSVAYAAEIVRIRQLTMPGGGITTATFNVATSNIATPTDLELVGSIPNGITMPTTVTVPAGNSITEFAIDIAANAGSGPFSLTLAVGSLTMPFSLRVGTSGTTSASIAPPGQTVTAGDSTTFTVITNNIASPTDLVLAAGAPAGITITPTPVTIDAGNSSTAFTVNTTSAVTPGSHPLTLTDGSLTATFNLVVNAPAGPQVANISAQSVPVIAGTGGQVSFTIDTRNIAVNAQIELVGPPAGVTLVSFPAGSGSDPITRTITVDVSSSVAQGSHPLTFDFVGISGVAFPNPRTLPLNVGSPAAPHVASIGSQSGTVNSGTDGQVSFVIETRNIATNAQIELVSPPAGITLASFPAGSGSDPITRTVTINVASSVTQGSHPLTFDFVGISGVAFPNPRTLPLNVGAPGGVPSISIGAQQGSLTAGTGGTVNFLVTTQNIAPATPIALTGFIPSGFSLDGSPTVNSSGVTAITIRTTDAVTAGVYSLELLISGTVSPFFDVEVSHDSGLPPQSSINVGSQTGALYVGAGGSATFVVTTQNIAAGSGLELVGAVPTGVTIEGNSLPTVDASGTTTIRIRTTEATPAGTHTLTLGVVGQHISSNFNLVVHARPTGSRELRITFTPHIGRNVMAPVTSDVSLPQAVHIFPQDPGAFRSTDMMTFQWLRNGVEFGPSYTAPITTGTEVVTLSIRNAAMGQSGLYVVRVSWVGTEGEEYVYGPIYRLTVTPPGAPGIGPGPGATPIPTQTPAPVPWPTPGAMQPQAPVVGMPTGGEFFHARGGFHFAPDTPVTRGELAQAIFHLQSGRVTPPTSGVPFRDTENSHFRQAVGFVSGMGFMNGHPDGTFRPDEQLSRAEAAAVLARVHGLSGFGVAQFTDTHNHWASNYVALAADRSVINGFPDNTFRPGSPLTRAEAAALLVRADGRNPQAHLQQTHFVDVSVGHWAFNYIMSASIPRQ